MKKSLPWLPLERIESLVQLEPLIVVFGLTAIAWFAYKFLLHAVSIERHRNLKTLFKNLAAHLVGLCASYGFYELLQLSLVHVSEGMATITIRVLPYAGLVVVFWGAVAFVKISRILFFEYLFLGHMREGVPLLLVNLFTFVLSMILGVWILTEAFNIQLTAFLATSAIVSVVLGLALQETLGNLFAAVALQFDKPYELGDWIEVQNGGQKWVGKVVEISWRATMLLGILDETISVPNRIIAQSQISNYAARERPFVRNHIFRLPFGCSMDQVRKIMIESTKKIPGVLQTPTPLVYVFDTTDSWISARLIYFLEDYGNQFKIADQVISNVLVALEKDGVQLAANRLEVAKN